MVSQREETAGHCSGYSHHSVITGRFPLFLMSGELRYMYPIWWKLSGNVLQKSTREYYTALEALVIREKSLQEKSLRPQVVISAYSRHARERTFPRLRAGQRTSLFQIENSCIALNLRLLTYKMDFVKLS